MIKICYFPSLNLPVCYWRIENYANELLKFNEDCEVFVDYFYHPEENIAWDKVCLLDIDHSKIIRQRLKAAFKHFDVLIFQKIQYEEGLKYISELHEKYPKAKILMETDDSIGDITPSNFFAERMKQESSISAIHASISDVVICSTEYMARSVHLFNKNTYVAPNCLRKEDWIIEEKELPKNNEFRVGYVAGGGHDEDLLIAYKSVLPILNDNKSVKFIIRYGGFRPDYLERHDQIDFEPVNWRINKYPQKLYDLNLDFAIAPLRDTEFNRCKSNIKWVESASLGVPLLASKVEPFINTQKNDCLITLTSNDILDFRQNLYKMINDKNDYNYLLKNQCFEKYNINKESRKLLDFLKLL